ncbi:putative ribonuclease H-like domain-containing protein [Tanacetum coccineum]
MASSNKGKFVDDDNQKCKSMIHVDKDMYCKKVTPLAEEIMVLTRKLLQKKRAKLDKGKSMMYVEDDMDWYTNEMREHAEKFAEGFWKNRSVQKGSTSRASLDRKSTTEGCQFLGKMLISWQCKKQTIVANSTIEAEYVAAANCCGQVLWIQNQMLDYSDEFGVKTGSCKVNAARQDLVLLGERTVTPLFQNMLAMQVVEGEGSRQPSETQPTPSPAPPSHEVQVTTVASHPKKTHTPRRAKRGWDTKIPHSSGPPKKVGDEAVYTEGSCGAYDDEDVVQRLDLNNLRKNHECQFLSLQPEFTRIILKTSLWMIHIFSYLNKRMTKISKEHAMVSYINKQRKTNHKDYQNCLFACFFSQKEPKKVIQALADPSWVEAMQEDLLQFRLQKVWTLVDLSNGKRAIGTKWVFRNKKDKRGIDRSISTIEEEVYVCQPPSLEDPQFPDKVYKVYVDDIIFGSTKKSLCVEFEQMMHKRFQMSSMGELTFFLGLQVKQKDDGIFISQDKYVADILKKFDFVTIKTTSTPIETNKALLKDEEAEDVDVHLYRSMIGSLMYLIASRPDIMFVVCACARFQVTPKVSHLHVVKRIFRYLKGQSKLGLWYPRDSPFDLEASSDSDYAGASLDRKSTTGGCRFLGKRLILGNVKKQTIVANSTTEVEYVAAANCSGQVLWIQNQMLDYGFNFMNTKIYIENENTICIVKNPVFHSKTKHIEIRHHFIRM